MLKRFERSYPLALLILAGAMLLAACGDNTSTATSAATTAAATTAASTTAAVATTAAATTAAGSASTAAAGATTAAAGGAALSADAQAGLQIVAKNCSMCHLQNGTADGGQGPNLSTSRDTTNAQRIQRTVRNGDGAMPPFSQQQISDADLAKVVAYLQAIHK